MDEQLRKAALDYPNQVNNVLCFPFVFRGALDVGATTITTEMELAAGNAIAELAQVEQSDIAAGNADAGCRQHRFQSAQRVNK